MVADLSSTIQQFNSWLHMVADLSSTIQQFNSWLHMVAGLSWLHMVAGLSWLHKVADLGSTIKQSTIQQFLVFSLSYSDKD